MALLLLSHPARQLNSVENLFPLRRTVKAAVFRKVTGPSRCIRTLPSAELNILFVTVLKNWITKLEIGASTTLHDLSGVLS